MNDRVATEEGTASARRALVVLGMHRSGTSLLAALLCTAGADAPRNAIGADEFNQTGYWEPALVQQLNDRMLDELGSSWDSELGIVPEFFRTARAQRFLDEMPGILEAEFGESPLFCLKDPRLSRLMPAWMAAFQSAHIEPAYIISVRNPLEVAESLKNRDGFHWSKSLMLWLRHTLNAEKFTRGKPRRFVSYDSLLHDWRQQLNTISEHLCITWPRRLSEIDIDFEDLISPQLRHYHIALGKLESRIDIPDWVHDVYHACIASANGEEQEQFPIFDRVRSEMAQADKAYEALLLLERGASRTARYEAGVAQARLEERDAERRDIHADLAARESRIGEIAAQLESARAELRERSARVDELTVAFDGVQEELQARAAHIDGQNVELSGLRGRLQAATAEHEARAAHIDGQNIELSRLRDELEAAKTDVQTRGAHVEELSAQLGAMRSELDRMTAQSGSRAQQAEALTAELAMLRGGFESATERLQAADARVCELMLQVETTNAELIRSRADAANSQSQLDELSRELVTTRSQLDRAASELRLAREEGHRAARDVDALSGRLAGSQTAAAALQAENERLASQLQAARSDLAASSERLIEARATLNSAESRNNQLSTGLAQARAELALTEEERAEERSLEEALRRESERLRASVATLEGKVTTFQVDLSAARAANAEALRELEEQRSAAAIATAEVAAITSALNAARADAATAEAQLAALQHRGRELARRLGERESELSEMRMQAATVPAAGIAVAEPRINASAGAVGEPLEETVRAISGLLERRRQKLTTDLCRIDEWRIEIDATPPIDVRVPGPVGVFVHIFYEDVVTEIAAAIKNIPFNFIVYVSTVDDVRKALIEMAFVRAGINNVVVKVLPNAGFDIGPFLFGFQDEIRRHEVCVRLHGKKSTHQEDPMFGPAWRRYLFDELLGDPDRVSLAVGAFCEHPELGALIPQHWPNIRDWVGIGNNWDALRAVLDRLEVRIDPEHAIEHPSGSMFWFRSAALEPLLSLQLTPEDFGESSPEVRDSSLAHGVERAFLFVAAKAGYSWAFLPAYEKLTEPSLKTSIELIRESGLFDAEYYLENNQDVARDGLDALEHYLRWGYLEGRNPNADFDGRYYSRLALRECGWSGNPLVHYVLQGKSKGMAIKPPPASRAVPALALVQNLYAPYERAERGNDYVPEAFPLLRESSVKVVAFYFPQFHPFEENDRFWGRGFTEWTNTTKALPMFPGHYQPRLPGELGFYDTRVKEVLARQIELAKQYGVYGFCFHHYFFDGKPVMRAPFNHMVANKDLDIPFCLHWANEPWTVRWDGLASSSGMLLDQHHSPEDDYRFFEDIAPALTDPRYITVDGRPLVVIYRPGLFPDMAATIERWRECCARLGLKDLYLAVMQAWFEGAVDPRKYGFDAAIEYPPHNIPLTDIASRVGLYDKEFQGRVLDYTEAVSSALARPEVDYTWFRGLFPDWDCTPRRANPDLFVNSSPQQYQKWLQELCAITERTLPEKERFVFVNSWNEWAEGAYLEPDRRYGYGYLDATAHALNEYTRPIEVRTTQTILAAAHLFYVDLLDEFLEHFDHIPAPFDVFLTVSTEHTEKIEAQVRERLGGKVNKVTIRHVENVGRDGVPFVMHMLPESQKYDLCCWSHSKKSPYDKNYEQWRAYLLGNLLGSDGSIRAIVERFAENPELGVLFPKPFPPVADKVEWGSNYKITAEQLSRLGIEVSEDEDPQFPPGMMFWFRPKALRPLLDLNLSVHDFLRHREGKKEQESGMVFDGTLSHALERMVLYVARREGYMWQDFLNEPFSLL